MTSAPHDVRSTPESGHVQCDLRMSAKCQKRPFEARGAFKVIFLFLADLRDAFFVLAFFFGVVRFLEATFFATFFFVRELGSLPLSPWLPYPRPLPAQP